MTSTLNRPDRAVHSITIGEAISKLMPDGVPFRFTAYDGSSAGPEDSPIHVHLENKRGLS
jgi:cyclopropane-fatty-acyl-phospholipid synthase